jgi:hypothetical protein
MITAAFELRLTDRKSVYCETLESARNEFQKFIHENGLGYSQLSRYAGNVRIDGKKVASISYNGRIWTPEKWPKCKEILPVKALDSGTA